VRELRPFYAGVCLALLKAIISAAGSVACQYFQLLLVQGHGFHQLGHSFQARAPDVAVRGFACAAMKNPMELKGAEKLLTLVSLLSERSPSREPDLLELPSSS
jgi:hypothetical protein